MSVSDTATPQVPAMMALKTHTQKGYDLWYHFHLNIEINMYMYRYTNSIYIDMIVLVWMFTDGHKCGCKHPACRDNGS